MTHFSWISLLCLSAVIGCSTEQPTPTPITQNYVPMVDPLSKVVTERLHAESLKRKAAASLGEGLPGAGPVRTAFALPNCDKVEGADMDGDGKEEVVCWGDGRLTFWSQGDGGLFEIFQQPGQEGTLPGMPNKMLVADIDNDGRDELIIGWGMSRTQVSVPISVAITEIEGESGQHHRKTTVVYREKGERPQVVGLGILPKPDGGHDLLVAHYESKYFVMAHRLSKTKDQWGSKAVFRRRMGSSWAIADVYGRGSYSWLVGRPYGDAKLEPGDLLLKEGAREVTIPTVRGIRSVTTGDLNGDGVQELIFGDGWHYDYGKKAEGRLSMATLGTDGQWTTHLIENTKGQYEIQQLELLDVDGDGQSEIIAAGNKEIRLYRRQNKDGWAFKATRLGEGKTFATAILSENQPTTLIVAGSPIRLLPLESL